MIGLVIISTLVAIGAIGFAIYTKVTCIREDFTMLDRNRQLAQENEELSAQNAQYRNFNKQILTEYETLIAQKTSIQQNLQELRDKQFTLNAEIEKSIIQKQSLEEQSLLLTRQMDASQKAIDSAVQNQKQLAQQAFESYCDALSRDYAKAENDYDSQMSILKNAYEQYHDALICALETEKETLLKDLVVIRAELTNIRATRAAAMEAQLKEREIKEQRAFYSIPVAEADLSDIRMLEAIKPRLLKPRVLSMLIWQTYYQKPMTQLCNNILGANTVCGIYKITNQNTDQCYIGQSVDVANRWKEHAKCGLGIDTPVGNKLYAAMQQDGLSSFTFELLEKCERNLLDEKEKQYIELYQAAEYGYNTLKGNNKK